MPLRWSAAAACGDSSPVTGTRRAPDGQAIGASGPSAAYSGVGACGLAPGWFVAGAFELAAGWFGALRRAPRRRDFFSMCPSVIEQIDRPGGCTRRVLGAGGGSRLSVRVCEGPP